MRIGMVAQSMSRAGGGVAEAMRLHAEALADPAGGGHEIAVFAARDAHSDADRALFGATPVETVATIGPRRFRYAPRLARRLIAADLDVVHVHGLWSPIGLSVLAWHRATGRPYVVVPHGMLEAYILARSPRLKRLVSRLFQDRLLARAAAIHALTAIEAEQARRHAAAAPAAAIVPNYVPPAAAAPTGRPGWWDATLDGRVVFLFLGRIHAKKGILPLLAAWDRLSAADAGFRDRAALVVCGWIDGLPDLEARIAEVARMHGNVRFAGAQFGPDKARSLAAADVFVLPSMSEGLPMAVLEAWSLGVPAILTPACNLPEGFAAGAAWPCGTDEAAIADALAAAVAMTPAERAAAGAAARALVAARFSREAVGRKLGEMVAAAARRPAPGRRAA